MTTIKNKYFKELESYIWAAEKGLELGSKSVYFNSILAILNLSLKVPDIYTIKYWYYAMGLYAEYLKQVENCEYAYSRLQDFAEAIKDYE